MSKESLEAADYGGSPRGRRRKQGPDLRHVRYPRRAGTVHEVNVDAYNEQALRVLDSTTC